MSSDDRPSIAELQRAVVTGYGWPNANAIAVNHATPVLLEIAAAALAWAEQERAAYRAGRCDANGRMIEHGDTYVRACEERDRLLAALRYAIAKVRQ